MGWGGLGIEWLEQEPGILRPLGETDCSEAWPAVGRGQAVCDPSALGPSVMALRSLECRKDGGSREGLVSKSYYWTSSLWQGVPEPAGP